MDLTYTGSALKFLAMSARQTMAAAAPSLTPQQSNNPRGQAIMGALRICSTETSLRRWALGFLAPLAWLLAETMARISLPSSGDRPYLAK